MAENSPSLPRQSTAEPQWDGYATVRIEHYMHVRFKYDAPHPDDIDNEAIEIAIGDRIEAGSGDMGELDDIEVTYGTVNAEVETWHHEVRRAS